MVIKESEELIFFATTIPGLEKVASEEITEITDADPEKEHIGMIRFGGEIEDIFRLNLSSKMLHRLLLIIFEGSFSDFSDIYDQIYEIDFSRYISSDQTFSVRMQRHGEHNFTSMDLESEIGQAIIDGFRDSERKKLEVDLDNPEIIFRGEVRHDNLWLSLDTTGQNSLHKRDYRVFEHPAPLKPTIAQALVRISDWSSDEALIDPMCGSGTICIEAALKAKNSADFFRDAYGFENFCFLDLENFKKFRNDVKRKESKNNLKVYGNDISEKFISGARENSEVAGVKVNYMVGDALEIEYNSYDRIVTNLPFGVRMGQKREMKEYCENFLDHLMDYSWKKAVILSDFFDIFPENCLEKSKKVKFGNLPVKVFELRKN